MYPEALTSQVSFKRPQLREMLGFGFAPTAVYSGVSCCNSLQQFRFVHEELEIVKMSTL